MRVRTRLVFLAALVALVGAIIGTSWDSKGMRASLERACRSQEAHRGIGLLVQAIDKVERAQSEYEDSRDDESLERYRLALREVTHQTDRVALLVEDQPDQPGLIQKIKDAANSRQGALERWLMRRPRPKGADRSGPTAQPRLGHTPFGLRTTIPSILIAENDHLERACRALNSTLDRALWTFALPCALGLTLLGAVPVLARRDLSLRDQRERERALALAQSEAARREAERAGLARDQFLAMLSHELRAPLAPVLMALTSDRDQGKGQADGATLEMVRRNIALEARLIDDLLDVSRVQHDALNLRLGVVDVHEALRRALEICQVDVAQARIEVVFDLGAPDHHVQADEDRLLQVFWNLIKNAAKFTPPGGRLTIRTWDQSSGPHARDGRRVVVEFRDTGQGIAPHVLPRLFNPFERGAETVVAGSRSTERGLGLGLAISRGIVECHGGRVTALSAGPGQGATFLVELPIAPRPEPTAARALARSSEDTKDHLEVLLVDDNQDTLDYAALVLRRAGHNVHKADSLAAARPLLAARHFDLMISDISLPDGSGLDLMLEVNGRFPAIALSGLGSHEDLDMSQRFGFAAHLVKPVDARTFLEAVRAAVQGDRHGHAPRV